MAGDDINKFVLDRDLPNGVTLEYTSFYGVTERQEGLRGRALLANDAVEVVQLAVRKVTGGEVDPGGAEPVPLNGLSVWHGIAETNGTAHMPGSTGFIDYGGETGQVPANKTISILRLNGPKTDPQVVWACGTADDPGCRAPD
ncbi:hypothetical protein GCM10009854_20150 [Saccharopolyspora halophila]|uniref:Uncharacterized protein n=1 Tax=Saccharopolyspora halophila TaxID=405551 RepID=A0ABN3G3E6_9PSEU